MKADATNQYALIPRRGGCAAIFTKGSEKDRVVFGNVYIVDNAAESENEIFIKWGG